MFKYKIKYDEKERKEYQNYEKNIWRVRSNKEEVKLSHIVFME
jgi:hypothetical protein